MLPIRLSSFIGSFIGLVAHAAELDLSTRAGLPARALYSASAPVTPAAPAAAPPVQCPLAESAHLTHAVVETASQVLNALGTADSIAGHCAPPAADLAESVAGETRQWALKSPALRMKKADGTPATADDWIAVDLIARTLFGEIGGSAKCAQDIEYFRAVGKVMMNRADYMKQADREPHTKFLKEDTSVKNDVARAAIYKDFQAWAPRKPSTGKKIVDASLAMRCSPTEIQKTYRDQQGNAFASTSMGAFLRWGSALEAATEMVFNEKSFRCSTASVKSLFYSRSNENPIPDGTVVKDAKIGQTLINNPACVQLWESPRAKLAPPAQSCAGVRSLNSSF